jgi:hypothetical protein
MNGQDEANAVEAKLGDFRGAVKPWRSISWWMVFLSLLGKALIIRKGFPCFLPRRQTDLMGKDEAKKLSDDQIVTLDDVVKATAYLNNLNDVVQPPKDKKKNALLEKCAELYKQRKSAASSDALVAEFADLKAFMGIN